jgi:hypothetical protein
MRGNGAPIGKARHSDRIAEAAGKRTIEIKERSEYDKI